MQPGLQAPTSAALLGSLPLTKCQKWSTGASEKSPFFPFLSYAVSHAPPPRPRSTPPPRPHLISAVIARLWLVVDYLFFRLFLFLLTRRIHAGRFSMTTRTLTLSDSSVIHSIHKIVS
jgi:hypothetical protein